MTDDRLRDRFEGALLGLFCGDALGMPYENWPTRSAARALAARPGMQPAAAWLRVYAAAYGLLYDPLHGIPRLPLAAGTYTDDTQMAIAAAESLVECEGFSGEDMARRFIESYDPRRGYGRGTARVLRALRRGVPWDQAGKTGFGGRGSFGNGAAMRAAPVGLFYRRERSRLIVIAEQAARVTHAHTFGRDGGVVIAVAVAEAAGVEDAERLCPEAFLACLRDAAHTDAFRARLGQIDALLSTAPDVAAVVGALGNGTAALDSVPAAVYCALKAGTSPEAAIRLAVSLGGDTDTIGAMAGAISGALNGASALPQAWLDALENGPKGRDYVRELAGRLFASPQVAHR